MECVDLVDVRHCFVMVKIENINIFCLSHSNMLCRIPPPLTKISVLFHYLLSRRNSQYHTHWASFTWISLMNRGIMMIIRMCQIYIAKCQCMWNHGNRPVFLYLLDVIVLSVLLIESSLLLLYWYLFLLIIMLTLFHNIFILL